MRGRGLCESEHSEIIGCRTSMELPPFAKRQSGADRVPGLPPRTDAPRPSCRTPSDHDEKISVPGTGLLRLQLRRRGELLRGRRAFARRRAHRRGVDARIVRCATQPTASIPRRADVLRRQVIRSGGLRARELHFVGHSTGGLDVRMLLTPEVKIASGDSEERIARLTRTAISVATPHHGTPLANHFVTVQGQTLLLVLSALATSGEGRGAILAAAKAIALIARLDDWMGRDEGPLDRIAETLLRKIRFNRRDPRGTTSVKSSATGRSAAAHPRGNRSVRCRRRGQPRVDYGLRRRRCSETTRRLQAEGTTGSGVRRTASAVRDCCTR